MAFNIQAYSRISGSANNTVVIAQDGTYVGAPQLYTYITPDTIATVSAANYFNLMAPVLNVGDLIFCTCVDGQVDLTVATIVVNPPAVTTTTGTSVGNVVGPASSINNDIVLFNGTTGKIIKDSGFTLGYVQAGTLIYAADGGVTGAYAITLNPVPAAYVTGMMLNFKANTANTGTASLNVNTLGAKTILKAHDQTLATGDIEAGQIVTVVYDGTNFQMQSQTAIDLPTGAANTVLQGQGAGVQPAYSTATYPPTTTVSQILYSSSTNTVAGLTTANDGVLVTNNTGVPSILAGPGTTGQVLQANTAAAPSFSTASYPSTTTVSQILYSSATNTVSGLATANKAVLTTGATGIPVLTALATDGQLIIGSTAGVPAAATLTAGAGVSITNGSNSITIAATGLEPWVDQTTTPVTMAVNTSYSANNAGLVTLNVPAVAAFGSMFEVAGQGAGGWLVQANTGQTIKLGSSATSVAGSLASTNANDCVKFVCTVANTTFVVISSIGNITVA